MPNTALSIESHRNAQSRSLIDELNSAVATSGEEQQARILERVADLFAAGSRGYSGDQIALFGDVLQRLAADIEVKARAPCRPACAYRQRASWAYPRARF